MSKSEEKKEAATIATLPIRWRIPENTLSKYANNILVQSTPHEIILSFFETQIPPLGGSKAENAAQLEEIGYLPANLVARIVVAPGLLPSIISALETGLDLYHEAYGTSELEE